MKRFLVVLFCLLLLLAIIQVGADEQPQKRVMNFLAVMDLKCGKEIEKEQCGALTDVLIDELVKLKKYTVIDRANRDKILSEAGFQQTACVDESCTIEMGRQLGVGKLVVGSITKLDETYLINLQLLNVETAAVENSAREICDKCKLNDLIASIANAARNLMGEAQPTPSSAPSPASPNALETSKLANSGLFPTYQPGKAMVIFYRPTATMAYRGNIKIYDGDKLIGQLAKGSYFYYETAPESHVFSFKATGLKKKETMLLSADRTIFIRYNPDNSISFSVEPYTGTSEAKACRYMPLSSGDSGLGGLVK